MNHRDHYRENVPTWEGKSPREDVLELTCHYSNDPDLTFSFAEESRLNIMPYENTESASYTNFCVPISV